MNNSIFAFSILIVLSLSCGPKNSQPGDHVQLSGDTCDNPDANINCCFINMPSGLTNTMTLIHQKEPGEKLIISGSIFKADGKTPNPNVILYAYHTDNKGYYSKNGTETGVQKWHGRLHGWCKSDEKGHYEIHTIKPAPYPDSSMPAHIHAAISEASGKRYWITDFVFKNEYLVNEKYLLSLVNVGGTGVVDIKRNSENVWTGARNLVLK